MRFGDTEDAWMNEMTGRTVVVTGASAGVGRAIALRFAAVGASLGLLARDGAALETVKQEIGEDVRVATFAADVADADAVFAAADKFEAELGPIDIWVNDAMVTVFSPSWETSPDEFRRVTEVTYLGFVHGTLAALRHMRPRGRGTIIQIGSGLSYRGIPLQSAYCGAKHAIRGFTDSVRTELLHEQSNIQLVMMQLPAVNTPQFDWARTHMHQQPRPVAPVFEPEVIAEAVLAAAQRPRREYWIGRSTLELILANSIVPEFFDRLLAKKAFAGQAGRLPVTPERRVNLLTPVHDLHRVHGRFGNEAATGATVVSGPFARLGGILLGSAVMIGVGALAGRLIGHHGAR
jgi:short-subunit dehydrogenase